MTFLALLCVEDGKAGQNINAGRLTPSARGQAHMQAVPYKDISEWEMATGL